MNKNQLLKFIIFCLLLLGAIFVLSPLAIVLFTSFQKSGSLAFQKEVFTFANYQQAWTRGRFLLAFANSTLVAIAVTFLQAV